MNKEKFITDNTITDRQAILKALSMPKSVPDSFKINPLIPIGYSKFKGDKLPTAWSANDQFEVGKIYPIYDQEGYFPIGKDGKGMKLLQIAWSRITFI